MKESAGEILCAYNLGSRRGKHVWRSLRAHFDREGIAEKVLGVPIDALARGVPEGWRPERVIAVGGDGTVNALASWLLDRGPSGRGIPLGIIPSGTGNNLARTLGIPRDSTRAAAIALQGCRHRRIDAIRCQPLGPGEPSASVGPAGAALPAHYMIQAGAWGFPASIAARYAALRRSRLFRILALPLGKLVYLALAWQGLGRLEGALRSGGRDGVLDVQASLPDEEIQTEALAVFAGNDPTLGGGFHPCPRALVDDGRFDLCIVRARGRRTIEDILRRVLRGDHLPLADQVVYRQSAGPVELRFRRPAEILVDGEIASATLRCRLETLPAALTMIVGR